MKALASPTAYAMTPAWRASIWRSQAFGIHSPLETWHPLHERDGEWYSAETLHDIPGLWSSRDGSARSWRRGIWTGGRHEAEARIDHHQWLWAD